MQKSINTIADVLDEIVTEETGSTLQSIAEQGGNIHLTRGYNKTKLDLERTHILLGAELNIPSIPHISSINLSPQAISLAAYSKSRESIQQSMNISLVKTMFSIRDKDKQLLSITGGAVPKYQFHFIENAIGDDTFTQQVVARPDGTLGMVNIKRKKRVVLERDIVITDNGTTAIDELSVNLEAGKSYKITSNIAVQKDAATLVVGLTEDQNSPISSDRFTLKYDFNSRYMNKVDRYTLSNNGELYFLTNAASITENNVVIFISGMSYPTSSGIIRIRLDVNGGEAKIFKGSFLEIEEL